MSSIKLIISDLHLADSHTVLEGFGDAQQAALEGLTAAARAGGPLGQADDVELIINGDAFDFLAVPPYDTQGTSDVPTALEKLNKIIAAHGPFFETLRQFIATPERRVTFITGNHDIELCFEEVRAQICETIGVAANDNRIFFCPTRFYRPLPDVYIEHGNQYDFWNHCISDLWDEQGQALDLHPSKITLPFGSHYSQHAAHSIRLEYAYFDHFEPSMNSLRQIALLCLLNPGIVIETARLTMQMLSEPRPALTNLAPGEERIPVKLFEQAMIDFADFQQDTMARKKDWVEPGDQDTGQARANATTEYAMLREALMLPLLEAVAAICTPATYQMGESVARGMRAVLANDPRLRYAMAGHTHMVRIDPVNNGAQSYLNTASWTTRLALPAPGEVNAALVEWLRQPDWKHIPLRDVTQFIFALVNEHPQGEPSSASLCVWEGGLKGSYRVLA
jgi:UDP-2,3-diacylglucosamine pyrophosphatase LpxH